MPFRRFALITLLLVSVFLMGCNRVGAAHGQAIPDLPSATALPTETETQTPLPTLTSTPTRTPTVTLTHTPTPMPTPTWVLQGPGKVVCPILLYHHIGLPSSPAASTYYVAREDFEMQMKALSDWGYTSISITQLTEAILHGARLPNRPVVITFDDGDLDVFTNAYPLMQKYGFSGVVYIVINFLYADGYMGIDQIKEMVAAGWEVGSHSMTHADLRYAHDSLDVEIAQSRIDLQEALGVPVMSFAYPFGEMDTVVSQKVQDYGYTSAVGLGTLWNQSVYNLYYLSRRPVIGGVDLGTFASYLPWSGPVELIPTFTLTP
ncbi:MAG: polysaccharide deacetylase family protein [Anaerolineales bacterium]|nr:polysaccharide deacetylase family protein [Anaerolineales bacterium]